MLGVGGDVDVQGVVKSTVARGEDDFPSGLLRVSDCHDSVVYALAPLQFASIYCCSDCTVVRIPLGHHSANASQLVSDSRGNQLPPF